MLMAPIQLPTVAFSFPSDAMRLKSPKKQWQPNKSDFEFQRGGNASGVRVHCAPRNLITATIQQMKKSFFGGERFCFNYYIDFFLKNVLYVQHNGGHRQAELTDATNDKQWT